MASAQEVVGVFDQDGNQLFVNATAIRALVNPSAKVMKHPLEDGASTTDHIVFEPVRIKLSVIPKPDGYQDTWQEMLAQFKAATTVTVQTKTDSFDSMLMQGLPFDETPEMFDTIAVAADFEEAIFVQAQYKQLPASAVKKKSNASTVKTGAKQPTDASPKQNSTAFDLIFGGSK